MTFLIFFLSLLKSRLKRRNYRVVLCDFSKSIIVDIPYDFYLLDLKDKSSRERSLSPGNVHVFIRKSLEENKDDK